MNNIPCPTVKRLVLYYHYLETLFDNTEDKVISSGKLGKGVGVTSAQVRKDLSYFGQLGHKGVGYEINSLKKRLKKIIGFDQKWPVVLIGAGNLGRALVYYKKFQELGLDIVDIFDCDLNKIGNMVNGIKVKSTKEMTEVIRKREIKIAVLAVPGKEARAVAWKLVDAGITAIWNFAPVPLQFGDEIVVVSEDLSSGIGILFFNLKKLS